MKRKFYPTAALAVLSITTIGGAYMADTAANDALERVSKVARSHPGVRRSHCSGGFLFASVRNGRVGRPSTS
jgi:hypothetical protein